MEITQDWFIIDPKNWFLATFRTFEQKCDELLPIYKIEKQEPAKISKELQQRIDNYLLDEADSIVEDAADGGEIIDEEKAWEYAVWNFTNDFDKIDADYEFIKFSEEDEPEAWKEQKLLILKHLKNL